MKKKLKAFLVICGFVLSAAGAQVLGKIDYVEGNVSVTRNGSVISRVDIGTPIENLDLVKTSKDGTVSISFIKSSGLTGTVQIVSGSTAMIRQDQLSGTSENQVQLMAGSVSLKVKRLAGMESTIQVRTPTAVLGVRGTEFVVASFNGSALVACKEGEVFCASRSEMTTTRVSDGQGVSSIPGRLVEILESGKLNTGDFPKGNFEKNWSDMQNKWKSFNVKIFVADPVTFMNQFVSNWSLYSTKVTNGAAVLRSNAVLQKWLNTSGSAGPSGSVADWIKERPVVMKDMIAVRADMMVALITWYRLQELVPLVPESAMNSKLANGQSVGSFVREFERSSKNVSDAAALFYAAEKQYMLRNDGQSPFSDF